MTKHLLDYLSKLPRLVKLIIIIFVTIHIFGFLIAIIEPEHFPSFLEGVWWALVTTSTVGYGDYVPHTTLGKLLGMALILLGAGFVTTYLATIAVKTITTGEKILNGVKLFTGKNHYIIIGWNERSRNIINSIHVTQPRQPIVLIDGTLDKHPAPELNLHFIKGDAVEDRVLQKASIQTANKVLITADSSQNEHQADMYSILSLLACKGLNPSLYCCVEILTASQVNNAKRAGADHIIETNLFAGETMASVLLSSLTVE
ncbi:MAG: potassium channel family protein [Bacillus sp. (in: firmicutes)]